MSSYDDIVRWNRESKFSYDERTLRKIATIVDQIGHDRVLQTLESKWLVEAYTLAEGDASLVDAVLSYARRQGT